MKDNKRVRPLTYVTAFVNQELLLQNEYMAAENRILRAHLPARLRLADPERSTLVEIAKRLGAESLGAGGLVGQARHYSCLVPEADRPHVRWIPGFMNHKRHSTPHPILLDLTVDAVFASRLSEIT
jgi:hypothetical protein